MANNAPGFAKKPDYRIDITPIGKRIRVVFNGETIADSDTALQMIEQAHQAVYYFPQADVAMDRMRRTEHSTHCPFKGDASYWTLTVGDRTEENAMWSYETPFDEVAKVGNYVAFYRDRMDEWYEDGELVLGAAH